MTLNNVIIAINKEYFHLFIFRLSLAIPKTDGVYDKCSMYSMNFTDILERGIRNADVSWEKTTCKNGWEYNYTDIPYITISSEVISKNY